MEKTGKNYQRKKDSAAAWLFGSDDANQASAGALLVGEARVLAFPVRSAKGAFAWITCPLALERFKRDAGLGDDFEIPEIDNDDSCLASSELKFEANGKVVLEEYCFSVKGDSTLFGELKDLIEDDIWQEIGKRFVILSDGMFSYFCEHACEVVTRVRINDETGTVANGALFNQENVPSETMFYAVIAAQDKKGDSSKTAESALETLEHKLASPEIANVLQIGGDETIGLGYCSVSLSQ